MDIRAICGCVGLFGLVYFGAASVTTISAQEIEVSSAANSSAVQLSPQEQAWVNQAQTWINNLTTLKAKFQQIAPDGKRNLGEVWIKRPGRIRFEYNKPSKLLLVANHGKMVFHDGDVGQTTTIPLDQNPLGLLLKPDLSFSGDVTITNFTQSNNGLFQITVVRTASPSDGTLTLIFNQNPVQLRAWRVVDAQGQATQVDLYDLKPGASASEKLFNTDFEDDN